MVRALLISLDEVGTQGSGPYQLVVEQGLLMPIPENDIKSELSYAYLHAIATRAGCICESSKRLKDNMGIDVTLTANGEFAPAPSLTMFEIYIQLKATSRTLPQDRRNFSLRIEKSQYDKLRKISVDRQWLLVLLVLPNASGSWLKCSPRCLTLKKCAYWVSLRNAEPPPTDSGDKITIFVPKRNRFTVEFLESLLPKCANGELEVYES